MDQPRHDAAGRRAQDARPRHRLAGSFAIESVPENGELLGMVTDRDICCRAVANGRDTARMKVREIMSKDVTTCFSDQDIAVAAHLMEGKHIRRLAVLNRDRKTVGFLSVDDLACYSHDLAGEVLEAACRTAH